MDSALSSGSLRSALDVFHRVPAIEGGEVPRILFLFANIVGGGKQRSESLYYC